MTFKFNGVEILQPTTHRWMPRTNLGYSGGGHPMYVGVREYQLGWNLASIGDFYQLLDSFNDLSGSSTLVVDLPKFTSTGTYTPFYSYTGCVIDEPEYSEWFNGYYNTVKLLIHNIRT